MLADDLRPGDSVLSHRRHPAAVSGPVHHLLQPLGDDGLVVDEHHHDGDGHRDQQTVEVGVAEVEPLHGLGVVVHGEAAARQGDGEGFLADEPPLPEGVEDDPDKGVQGGDGPEGEDSVDAHLGRGDLFHGAASFHMSSRGLKTRLAMLENTTPSTTMRIAMVEP